MAEGDFADSCAALWRGFRASGGLLPARKSEVLPGELDGMAVVAKRLARPNAVWQWYWEREVAIYRAFAATPPVFRTPVLVAVDERHGILVVERLSGDQVAKRRHPHAELDDDALDQLIALRAQIAAWPGTFPRDEPPSGVRTELRKRILEDPTAPVAWVREGIWRGVALEILDRDAGNLLDDAIGACEMTASCHGDLLLRNAIVDRGTIALADWECAGPHLADWDLALVWAQLGPQARGRLEDKITGAARKRAFLALGAFALIREVSFLRVFRAGKASRSLDALVDELRAALDRVRIASG